MANKKSKMVGTRERPTNAATSLVRSFEPINPLRRSENSLKTLRTIRKSRSRIRMMLMLVRPYTRMLAEMGSSCRSDN